MEWKWILVIISNVKCNNGKFEPDLIIQVFSLFVSIMSIMWYLRYSKISLLKKDEVKSQIISFDRTESQKNHRI